MKTLFIKTILVISLITIYSCKAQSTADYINFYNNLVPKLNTMVPNKAQYYNQNFSNFYNQLQNENINIESFLYSAKVIPGTKYYILTLHFAKHKMWRLSINNDYQLPAISITFQSEIPPQIDQLSTQSQGKWNPTIAQFFANIKIEKIEFIGLNGYDSQDNSLK